MAAKIPYIGSKISLISKAQIRYEGTLYTINPYEATVALQSVRSFGTEDRPTTVAVPPRDEVYEYIIFRGSDIKDIHVCEAPPLPQDPAIVESSQPKPAPIGTQDVHHGAHGTGTTFSQFAQSQQPGPGAPGRPGMPPSGMAPGSQAPGSRLPGSLPSNQSQLQAVHAGFAPQNPQSSQSSTPGNRSTGMTDVPGRLTPTQDQSTQVSQAAIKKSNNLLSKKAEKEGATGGSRGSTPTADPGQHGPSPDHPHHHGDRRQGRGARGNQHQHHQQQHGGGDYGYRDPNGYQPQHQHQHQQHPHQQQQQHQHQQHQHQQQRRVYDFNRHGQGEHREPRRDGEYRDRRNEEYRDPRGRQFRPRGSGRGGPREYSSRDQQGGSGDRGGYRPRGGGAPMQRGRPRGGGGGGARAPRELLHFDEDFDFETANAQFNKEDLERELKEKLSLGESEDKVTNGDEGGSNTSDAEDTSSFYDKENFFDNISCESRDREEGKRSRPNWKEERKTNTETFGLSSTRDLRYYGRGGGYRGRGMYRGGSRGGRGSGGWAPRGGRGGYRGRNNYNNRREDGAQRSSLREDNNRQPTSAPAPAVPAVTEVEPSKA